MIIRSSVKNIDRFGYSPLSIYDTDYLPLRKSYVMHSHIYTVVDLGNNYDIYIEYYHK